MYGNCDKVVKGLNSLEFNADNILGGYNCSSLIPQASLLAQNS